MRFAIAFVMFLLLVACSAEPTPFPVSAPETPTVAVQLTDVPDVRYAFSANTIGYVEELPEIEAQSRVELITDVVDPAELGTRFDLVATYGAFDGWNRSPVDRQVMLVVNPTADPLTPQVSDVLRRSIQPQSIVAALGWPGMEPSVVVTTSASALREEMANLGYPDGLRIVLGHTFTPGIAEVADQLAAINVRTRILALQQDDLLEAMNSGHVQMALVTWVTPEAQQAWQSAFGAASTANLYNLPISYLTVPGLSITFTDGGWPLGTWEP
jgi:hypothetical protein